MSKKDFASPSDNGRRIDQPIEQRIDRRAFMGGAFAMTGALSAGFAQAQTQAMEPASPRPATPAGPLRGAGLYRVEADIRDCEVEGKIPSDLNGVFYRVGADFQYKPDPRTIPFDGEGHASMFSIRNGRVDFRSRFIRNERYLAQAAAGRNLFPLYRNPYRDDPSVKGLSRSTANTHIIHHKHLLL